MALTEDDKTFIVQSIQLGMTQAMRDHEKSCSVRRDYYGNGKPGTKTEVHDLKRDLAGLKGSRMILRQLVVTIVAGVLTGVLTAAVLMKVLPDRPAQADAAAERAG